METALIISAMINLNIVRIATLGDAARVDLDRETWFELYTLARGEEVA